MNLYEKTLNNLNYRHGLDLNALSYNQAKVQLFETIIKALKLNNIEADEQVTVHGGTSLGISFIAYLKNPKDDDVIKAINIICALVETTPNSATSINDDITLCTYGYKIKGAGGIEISVSLRDYTEHFTITYLQHLLAKCQNTLPEVFFIGVDKTAPGSDMTAVAFKENFEQKFEVPA